MAGSGGMHIKQTKQQKSKYFHAKSKSAVEKLLWIM